MKRATFDLVRLLPIAVTGTTQAVEYDESLELGGQWAQARERAGSLLGEIRVQARWMRNAGAIRDEASDLSARLGAATLRHLRGDQLAPTEVLGIGTSDLTRAVFGEQHTLEAVVAWYEQHGFEGRAPSRLSK